MGYTKVNGQYSQDLLPNKMTFAFRKYYTVADPGFSRGGGVNPPGGGGVNTPNFPENCMKSKEFGCPGGGVRPSRPP